jgi:hypothetical protein
VQCQPGGPAGGRGGLIEAQAGMGAEAALPRAEPNGARSDAALAQPCGASLSRMLPNAGPVWSRCGLGGRVIRRSHRAEAALAASGHPLSASVALGRGNLAVHMSARVHALPRAEPEEPSDVSWKGKGGAGRSFGTFRLGARVAGRIPEMEDRA